jgi:Uma2 family endonuclease
MSTLPADPAEAIRRLKLPMGFRPTWSIVGLFPSQGDWTEDDYLSLAERLEAGRLLELVDGQIEVLPVPTEEHQLIDGFPYEKLNAVVRAGGLGIVLFAGLRVRLKPQHFRLPDLVFMSARNRAKRSNRFWQGADLAMEIVSEDDPDRDYVEKRAAYAAGGIKEYWTVDPRDRSVTLLVLKGRKYQQVARFADGDQVASVVLPDFSLAVSAIFDPAKE